MYKCIHICMYTRMYLCIYVIYFNIMFEHGLWPQKGQNSERIRIQTASSGLKARPPQKQQNRTSIKVQRRVVSALWAHGLWPQKGHNSVRIRIQTTYSSRKARSPQKKQNRIGIWAQRRVVNAWASDPLGLLWDPLEARYLCSFALLSCCAKRGMIFAEKTKQN